MGKLGLGLISAVLLMSGHLASGAEWISKKLQGCNDEAEWPPYFMVDKKASAGVTGASTEVMKKIFERAGLEYSLEPIAWKRCMEYVKSGEREFLWDASDNPTRAHDYLYTNKLYQINHAFYYVAEHHPDGLDLSTVAKVDALLKKPKFRMCAVRGYNIQRYGFNWKKIDQTAADTDKMIKKLNAKFCTVAIGYREIWAGYSKLGRFSIDGLKHTEIPDSRPLEFFMMISRKYDKATILRDLVNYGMRDMKASGEFAKIFASFGVPYSPPPSFEEFIKRGSSHTH